VNADANRKKNRYHFDRHTPEYRHQFETITAEMHAQCPIAWTDTYDGHWVAAGAREVFELARSAAYMSSDHDIEGKRRGYKGITIPPMGMIQNGFVEMDPPEQRQYRQVLNPYLSPAAVARWIPVVSELVRACLDEKIETGRIDFVDDLANVVPAVLTLAMMGLPLRKWSVYSEPMHAGVDARPDSPERALLHERAVEMGNDLFAHIGQIREAPRPGMVDAVVRATINGKTPDDMELFGVLLLIMGGGFDTTTALTAHSLEWLSEHPDQRERLSRERETLLDSATEEFLRFYSPAPGTARTISADCEIVGTQFREGERLWLSFAMANRDPSLFPDPNRIDLARTGNRHHSFGLGIHRCIGSNVARMEFKQILTAVLDRMPDFRCDPEGAVHYETIGVIQGMRHLPATFTPGPRLGPGLDETIARMQHICDEQRLAEPVTIRTTKAEIVH